LKPKPAIGMMKTVPKLRKVNLEKELNLLNKLLPWKYESLQVSRNKFPWFFVDVF
jgi:hypothetical protein